MVVTAGATDDLDGKRRAFGLRVGSN